MKDHKSKKSIRVILTSSRGSISLGRIESLKQNPDFNFYIIGVDASDDSYKLPLLDEQIRVPFGHDPAFAKAVKKIAIEKKVDVVVPVSDFEVEAISRYKSDFSKAGIACVCSSHFVTRTAINKASMLQYLDDRGVDVPRYAIPKNVRNFEDAVIRLGYPQKTLVFKSALAGGGNRGVWFIKEDFSRELLHAKGVPFTTLPSIVEQLKNITPFPEVVLMEYLPGEEYSVDGLGDEGRPVYVIPRVRVLPMPGFSQEALIKSNKEILDYVSSVCRIFGFESAFNVQLKYAEDGKPKVYEINPRVSATIVANTAAGIDLFLFSILQALRLPYKKNLKPASIKMIRFWKEFYEIL